MARERTGNIERRKGKPAYVRVKLQDGTPKRIPLPKGCSEAMAEEKRIYWTNLANTGQLATDPSLSPASREIPDRRGGEETVSGWAKRWIATREDRGLATHKEDAARLKNHVLPIIGTKAMVKVTSDDLESVRDALDAKVRERARWEASGEKVPSGRMPGMSGSTAANVWGNVTSMFSDAARSKDRSLRCRVDNPADGLEGPDAGVEKEGPFLYPSDLLRLLSSEAVPLHGRRLVALAVYLGTRSGELRALTWADVDAAHGKVSVTKQIDRKDGKTKATKTRSPRHPDIEPTLLPLLEAMKGEPGERITWMPPEEDQAGLLRQWCRAAGLTRAALYENTPTTRWLTFHDCRHTTATWMAARGQSAMEIMQRTGHKTLAMVQRYVERFGDVNKATFGEAFPALPASLLVATPEAERATGKCHRTISKPKTAAFLRPQWELNPCYRRERPVS